jgi:hypothetical protein
MAGVGKLMKQAAKMQKQMEDLQEELAAKVLEVTSGGGAVTVRINGQGTIQDVDFDPEFLKEDVGFVRETLLEAIKEAQEKAKAESDEAMSAVSGGMNLPGLM